MAEFLVYNKTHWMDTLTSKQMDELRVTDKHFDQRYAGRYQKGDVVEVRPDGYWTGIKARGFDKSAFCVVVVKNLTTDAAKYISTSLMTTDVLGKPTPAYQSKYKFDIALTQDVIQCANLTSAKLIEKT